LLRSLGPRQRQGGGAGPPQSAPGVEQGGAAPSRACSRVRPRAAAGPPRWQAAPLRLRPIVTVPTQYATSNLPACTILFTGARLAIAAFTGRFLNPRVLRILFMSATPHTEQIRFRIVLVVLRLRCSICGMPANDPNKATEVSIKDALSFMVGFSPPLLISL